MEKPKPMWVKGIDPEEVLWIKKRLGEGYENIPFRTTEKKSTGGISTIDEELSKITGEAEAEITEQKSIEEEVGMPGIIKKLKEEIGLLNVILEEVKEDDELSNIEKMKKVAQVKNAIKRNEEKIEKIIDSN